MRRDCSCGILSAMRRIQSAIVIVALLAVPAALLARTGPCAPSDCSQMCGMILRGAHAHRHCVCGTSDRAAQCSTQSQKTPDYGLNAPIAPTMVSARVAIAPPVPNRRAAEPRADFVFFDFAPEFFEPPRA